MQFSVIRPLFPTLQLPSPSQSPLFSQLVEKRTIIKNKTKLLKKDPQPLSPSPYPTKLHLLLHSINNSLNTKIIHLTHEQKQSFHQFKQKQMQRSSFEIKVQSPFSRERRNCVRLRPLRKVQETQSNLQLKCNSVFTRKEKVGKIKYKTEIGSESNLINMSFKEERSLLEYDTGGRTDGEIGGDGGKRNTGRSKNAGKQRQIKFNLERAKISISTSPSKNNQSPIQIPSLLPSLPTHRINKPIIQYNSSSLKHIKAESYCVMQLTGQLILSCKSNKLLEIASLTKVMTAVLIARICKDHSLDPSGEKVVVKKYVEESTGTTAELLHGDIFTVEQLLYGLLLPSGNDAALVLADWGGKKILTGYGDNQKKVKSNWRNNINAFVQEMNSYSQTLGLKNTKYANPHGLPHPQAKSTAFDQSKLAITCLQNPLLSNICQTLKYSCQISTTQSKTRKITWENTNKLLRRQGFCGLKTGITVTAGPCLITAYKFRDKTYIITVLRANKVSRRFKDSRKIIHWVLMKIYGGDTCFEETLQLEKLGKNSKYLDSDYSEDEQQFRYENEGVKEIERRKKILVNQLG